MPLLPRCERLNPAPGGVVPPIPNEAAAVTGSFQSELRGSPQLPEGSS
jgi:hypothetical protein